MTRPEAQRRAWIDAAERRDTAEEALVERVARAIFDVANPIVAAFPDYWHRVVGGVDTRNAYRRQARAAIDVVCTPVDGSGNGRP